MVALDVGANVGYYTRLFSRIVRDQGRVLAFEPHPDLVRVLRKNVGMRTNVAVYPIAAGSRRGRVYIHDFMPAASGTSTVFDPALHRETWARLSRRALAPRGPQGFRKRAYL